MLTPDSAPDAFCECSECVGNLDKCIETNPSCDLSRIDRRELSKASSEVNVTGDPYSVRARERRSLELTFGNDRGNHDEDERSSAEGIL